MKATVTKIRKEALSLSASERASLAHDIIISLDEPANYFLGNEYEAEIKRRIKSIKQGKAHVQSAASVFSEIKNRSICSL